MSSTDQSSSDISTVKETGSTKNICPTTPKSDDETRQDVERLWEEHNDLKTAVTTLETSVGNLSEEVQNLVTVIHELKKSSEATDIAKEKKLDDKLQVFLKAATDNCVGEV